MLHHDSLMASPTMNLVFIYPEYLSKIPSPLRQDFLENGIHHLFGNMRPEDPSVFLDFKVLQDGHQR